ncbi:NAD(P)/FAD-dependent oxidoreductase [Deinococcus cellulosilyticus]|uniref:Pyridine nucleotide-disulfide oxidoreductase n=1 Tax=Deinococcus cellulosilyticus (strain DSM 18568 / NBRC 106333 / KACC 11606 / 5516J-15) TaxID=1223518 RepID=A0A511MZW0_DEIC1|nr:NAD(P)/FAD-dependent oxidoreductase [Deinococcus cellulosilyticus]GEM46092.1 pyridine nucleotide-disulfide oxidoreductase [Deinococcus cellulosilyticus NBRC 106333 = KACC 11606]
MIESQLYDTIIIGGGPAGLTAALHLAFHKRKVLVVDRRTGPLWYTTTPLWNVPGFIGKPGVTIQKTMLKEAQEAGAEVVKDSIVEVSGSEGHFQLTGEKGVYQARTLLLATGVARHHPLVNGDFEPWFKYAAKGNTYYCPDCESPELLGQDVVVIESHNPNGGVSQGSYLAEFASRVRLLLTGPTEFKPEWEAKRKELGFDVIEGQIQDVEGSKGRVHALILNDGTRVEADAYYVSNPKFPRNDLAKQLGAEIGPRDHIVTGPRGQLRKAGGLDTEFIPGVWAAGDVQPQTQQVTIAMGSGNKAAVMIDQHLTHLQLRQLGKTQDVVTAHD